MSKIIRLSQALNAKLCHDLAGSIGTVNNCLGLIDNSNKEISEKSKELAILESENLVKKIQFFRIAYGLPGSDEQVSIIGLIKIFQDFFNDTKISFSLKYDPGVIYINSITSKAIICLVLLARDASVMGGKIVVFIPKKDEDPILVTVTSAKIMLKGIDMNVLSRKSETELEVSNCREHYINELCDDRRYQLKIEQSDNDLVFKMCKKIEA
jgi:histidine phosphotransferase ChpT